MDLYASSAAGLPSSLAPGEYETTITAFPARGSWPDKSPWGKARRPLDEFIPFSTKRLSAAAKEPGPMEHTSFKHTMAARAIPEKGSRDDLPTPAFRDSIARFGPPVVVDDEPGPAEGARVSFCFGDAMKRSTSRLPKAPRPDMATALKQAGFVGHGADPGLYSPAVPELPHKPTKEEREIKAFYDSAKNPPPARFDKPKPRVEDYVTPAGADYDPDIETFGNTSMLLHGGSGLIKGIDGSIRRDHGLRGDVKSEDVDNLVLERVAVPLKSNGKAPTMMRDVPSTGTFGASRRMGLMEFMVMKGDLPKPGTAPGPGSYGSRDYVGYGRLGKMKNEAAERLNRTTSDLTREYNKTLKRVATAEGADLSRVRRTLSTPKMPKTAGSMTASKLKMRRASVDSTDTNKTPATHRSQESAVPKTLDELEDEKSRERVARLISENNYGTVFDKMPTEPARMLFKHPSPTPLVIPHFGPRAGVKFKPTSNKDVVAKLRNDQKAKLGRLTHDAATRRWGPPPVAPGTRKDAKMHKAAALLATTASFHFQAAGKRRRKRGKSRGNGRTADLWGAAATYPGPSSGEQSGGSPPRAGATNSEASRTPGSLLPSGRIGEQPSVVSAASASSFEGGAGVYEQPSVATTASGGVQEGPSVWSDTGGPASGSGAAAAAGAGSSESPARAKH